MSVIEWPRLAIKQAVCLQIPLCTYVSKHPLQEHNLRSDRDLTTDRSVVAHPDMEGRSPEPGWEAEPKAGEASQSTADEVDIAELPGHASGSRSRTEHDHDHDQHRGDWTPQAPHNRSWTLHGTAAQGPEALTPGGVDPME